MAKDKEAQKPKEPKAKQLHMEGMAPVVNQAIEKLADEYDEAKKERMAILKVEVELKGKLIKAMKAERLTAYDLGEYDIELEPGEDNVKVWIGKKKATKKAKE